jgi:hypothetical protein
MTLCERKRQQQQQETTRSLESNSGEHRYRRWPWKEGEEKDEIMRADFQV